MPIFWFMTGILSTLAALVVLSPWLRSLPQLAHVTAAPWRAAAGAAILVMAVLGLYAQFGHPNSETPPAPRAGAGAAGTATSFGAAAKVFSSATGTNSPTATPANPASPAANANAGSMESAVASLEARLAKGGGSPGDWELLAKSFEFLGRPADAAKARAQQLPALGDGVQGPAAAGASVTGEVTLDAALSGKTAVGDTLFIVAKSADSPGMPLAVIRTRVGSWPVKFTLDDTQSMMPGRTLSSARRVTIEARISKKGQPLPAAGDLEGSSGVIDPADHAALHIMIDHVIS